MPNKMSANLMGLVQFGIKLCTAKPWESDFDPPEKVNNVRETI